MPSGMNIFVSGACIHVSPNVYGPDPLAFRPTRWLQKNAETGREELVTPPKGTFLPWSEGPRYCPGSKMAQVEFVAVIFTVLSQCRVEVAENAGESKDAARERFRQLIADSQPKIALQLRNPEEAWLKFLRR